MYNHFTVLFLALSVASAVLLVTIGHHRRRASTLPPGPQGWPLIGNIFDMPTTQQWKRFAEWGQRWGDLMSISLLGRRMVIINSSQIAMDLFEKRSSIYSARPTFVVAGEMVGWDRIGSQVQYGPKLRETRRLFSQFIGTREKVADLAPLFEAQTHRFLLRTLRRPENLVAHIRQTAGAIILLLAYGYKAEEDDDPFVRMVHVAVSEATLALSPAAFLVDVFPYIKYVPSWVPGLSWKKRAKSMAKNVSVMCNMPFDFVEQQMAAGTAIPSFTSRQLEHNLSPERKQLIKDAAASLYIGGSDTTVSLLSSFFLAMMCYPEVQKKAQMEIDTVVGTDRLPTLADRDNLPYVNALCLEVMRWNPTAPIGFPHVLSEDDYYGEFFFSKGTAFIANIWQFLHDTRTYSSPSEFMPERYLPAQDKVPEQDPRAFVFGFGRRSCPGLQFADASIFVSCAMSLAVFEIFKPVVDGVVVEPTIECTSGVISHPVPFEYSVKPRSAKAESLILNAELIR
ncbi:cytochrome P450 [Laetiporus sulphureus 93-53]|uniref:Cytochrome P450 n=1 Tax=Laetiporus sulphureus 93-53 TaxID=1314785 RepID=A0A165ICR6_9APHY|nr:cytochrome P450 [Laetiporus sulphureus 93-53]KZT12902.1 cytochrome P450 [Laetiporus sulphureus 93-53]